MRRNPEIQNPDASPAEQLNQQDRTLLQKAFSSLGLRTRQNLISLPFNENNAVFLSAEQHTLPPEKNGSNFTGCPGATITNSVVNVTQNFTNYNNLSFVNAISIASAGSAIFNGCRFSETVAMTAGARAHFIGCYFYKNGSVQNTGVATDAYIIGCVNKSGIAHTNVTIISETT